MKVNRTPNIVRYLFVMQHPTLGTMARNVTQDMRRRKGFVLWDSGWWRAGGEYGANKLARINVGRFGLLVRVKPHVNVMFVKRSLNSRFLDAYSRDEFAKTFAETFKV